MSPLAMINAWYLHNPPWKQVERHANNAGEFSTDWEKTEEICRRMLQLRMQLIPYLHAAFVRYHREGLPPFRALVMDYPDDPQVWSLSDEYLMGDCLLVAPVIVSESSRGVRDHLEGSGSTKRSVYLPEGEWFDFWTGEKHLGKQRFVLETPLDRIPLFVKAGSILPLAQPTLHTEDPESWVLAPRVYGERARSFTLYEDDGALNPTLTEVSLQWNPRTQTGQLVRGKPAGSSAYSVSAWTELH